MITKTATIVKILARGKVARGDGGMILRFGKSYLRYDCVNEKVWFFHRGVRRELKGWVVGKLVTIHQLVSTPF